MYNPPGKIKTANLREYEYWNLGKTERVWVDEDNKHPDPNKLLIWGFDDCGDTVPGDFKRSFTPQGKPIRLNYDTKGLWTAADENKRKLQTIRSYILSLNACKR